MPYLAFYMQELVDKTRYNLIIEDLYAFNASIFKGNKSTPWYKHGNRCQKSMMVIKITNIHDKMKKPNKLTWKKRIFF